MDGVSFLYLDAAAADVRQWWLGCQLPLGSGVEPAFQDRGLAFASVSEG